MLKRILNLAIAFVLAVAVIPPINVRANEVEYSEIEAFSSIRSIRIEGQAMYQYRPHPGNDRQNIHFYAPRLDMPLSRMPIEIIIADWPFWEVRYSGYTNADGSIGITIPAQEFISQIPLIFHDAFDERTFRVRVELFARDKNSFVMHNT